MNVVFNLLYRKSLLAFFISGLTVVSCENRIDLSQFKTTFETSDSLQSATYEDGIAWWKKLEEQSPYVCVQEKGETDAGLPLHLVVINKTKNFSLEKIRESNKPIWLINNAIHPGEPDGVDASMLFVRELLSTEEGLAKLDSVCILIIPYFNVGGALNRNCCSRANQAGPESYGFRGNANNLDLNRDFMKADSKNARTFLEIFRDYNPDVYLETHVSNGADYQYTMTYLFSHPDKLASPLRSLVNERMIPALNESMTSKNEEMTPYVNLFGAPPDSGFSSFYDTPRYSTGFTALHNSIGMLTETHMLKPFNERVEATRKFMHSTLDFIVANSIEIKIAREAAKEEMLAQSDFIIDWEIDQNQTTPLKFKGYEAYYDTSEVTGLPQLHYNREKPFEKDVPYFAQLKETQTVSAPKAYLVPASREKVIDRLKLNGVEMNLIDRDTNIKVVAYQIDEMETASNPYEGHYYHSKTKVEPQNWKLSLRANEYYLISTDQDARRFLVESLDPRAPDSYFNWNFFDEILQQKEWFSSYVFEPEAKRLLDENDSLRSAFLEKKESDSSFAANPFMQLYFIYKESDHFERFKYMIYPVYRVE